MVLAMGGPEDPHYEQMLKLSCSAFDFIRQRGGLYMDLLTLMRDADLQSMGPDPEEALKFVSDKLRLDLNKSEADVVMVDAIQRSVAAFFPLLVDYIHTLATRLR
jgi:phosphatidylinositol 3-kinase